MAGTKKAPGNGVIRNAAGNARRVRAGALVPEGWTFDDGTKAAAPKKAKANMKAAGPSETSAANEESNES